MQACCDVPKLPAPLQGATVLRAIALLALKCQASRLRCFAALWLRPTAAIETCFARAARRACTSSATHTPLALDGHAQRNIGMGLCWTATSSITSGFSVTADEAVRL